MGRRRDYLIAIAATFLINLVFEIAPQGGLLSIGVALVIAAVSFVRRDQMPFAYRLFAIGFVFSFGTSVALMGRTMDVRITWDGVVMSSFVLLLFVSLPLVSLAFIWPGKRGIALASAGIPICLLASFAIAELEERAFVMMNPTGAEITARWTVSNHWFAYDPAGRGLYGSD